VFLLGNFCLLLAAPRIVTDEKNKTRSRRADFCKALEDRLTCSRNTIERCGRWKQSLELHSEQLRQQEAETQAALLRSARRTEDSSRPTPEYTLTLAEDCRSAAIRFRFAIWNRNEGHGRGRRENRAHHQRQWRGDWNFWRVNRKVNRGWRPGAPALARGQRSSSGDGHLRRLRAQLANRLADAGCEC